MLLGAKRGAQLFFLGLGHGGSCNHCGAALCRDPQTPPPLAHKSQRPIRF